MTALLATAWLATAATAASAAGKQPSSASSGRTTGKRVASAAFSYDLVTALGNVYAFGGAGYFGDASSQHLDAPIVAMAVTPDGHGYWLVGSDGAVFNFGDAHWYGSLASQPLDVGQQIVTIVATPDGKGYWLVDQSGAVSSFGDAAVINGGQPLPASELATPIVSAAIAPDGDGAWFTDAVGHVYGSGEVQWFGSRANKQQHPITAIALVPSGGGYWLADAAGDVWGFGDAAHGAPGPTGLAGSAVGLIPAQNGLGYWVATSAASVISGGDATGRTAPTLPGGIFDVVGIAAAPRVEPSKLPAGAIGYDINWPQCASTGSPEAGTLPGPPANASGSRAYSIAVVGVDGWAVGPYNSCLGAEVAWAKKASYPAGSGSTGAPPYDLYMFLNSPSPGTPIDQTGPGGTCDTLSGKAWQTCLVYNYGYNSALAAVSYAASQGAHAKVWWLDIENDSCAPGMWNDAGNGQWWSCDLGLNATTIQGALDALRSLHLTPGIYCTSVQWAGITDSYLPTGGAPLIWIAGAYWTSPPYPQSSGYPGPGQNTSYCTEAQYRFAGGTPVMLQETPGPNNYPFDPDISC
ncbi:MAG: hypothetical protein ACLQNG_02580 [Acidimicrobiales bacterium]